MSSIDSEMLMTCAACGASIYREHIHRGLAGMWGGQMLCPACLKLKREPAPAAQSVSEALDSIPLAPVDGPASEAAVEPLLPPPPDKIAAESVPEEGLAGLGLGGRRVRSFHAKLSEAALRHMDEQVNTWLNENPTISVKFANTTVGIFEGKHAEPNLILTVFY